MNENIAILIIARNEERSIKDVIVNIPIKSTVYVVDDGSGDSTAGIARSCGAKVISLPINIGQGAAVIVGYKITATGGHDFIVKMDGDGQHDPAEIPKFIKALKLKPIDMVIGSRILGSNYKEAPFLRKAFLKPITYLINKLTGYNLTDAMCGFRAFRGKSLTKMIRIFDKILEPEYMASEMLIRFSKAKITVDEVPIHMQNRKHGYSYKGMFRYGLGIAIAIIRTKIDLYIAGNIVRKNSK